MKKRIIPLLVVSVFLLGGCGIGERLESLKESMDARDSVPTQNVNDSVQNEEKNKPEEVKNLILEMDSAELREVNIFLSNFSEAFYDPSDGYFSEAERMINFAFTHMSINYQSMLTSEGEYMGAYADDVDNILIRFFGKTVPHETPKNSKQWIYKNNKFLMPAAAGDSYADFSIATEMREYNGENYEVLFNVYNDPSITGGDIITDKSIYSLTDSQAAEKYKLIGHGTAVLKPKTHNGENTYELVSYLVKDN